MIDWIISFLVDWGYWGMLVAAFLAGSFFPFSSEAVMVGLQAAGLAPLPLVIYGSIGNVLGSMFNYGVGRLGKMEWIERYLHVKKESLDKAERFTAGRGAMDGILRLPPTTRECRHHRTRIDQGKRPHFHPQHHHRESIEICASRIWREFHRVSEKFKHKTR